MSAYLSIRKMNCAPRLWIGTVIADGKTILSFVFDRIGRDSKWTYIPMRNGWSKGVFSIENCPVKAEKD